MPKFASLALASLGFLLPAAGTLHAQQDPAPKLSAGDLKSLNGKLAKMVEAQTAYDEAGSNSKQRDKAAKNYDSAKDAFFAEFDRLSEKLGDKQAILKSMPDLEAVFANCFPYERKSALSLRKVDAKDGVPAYWLSVPKSYKAEVPNRALLLVPGLDEKGEWTDGKKWFEATWTDKAPLAADTLIHVPVVAKEVDLDTAPDYSKTEAEQQERQRNAELMLSYGDTQRTYNVDRSRRFVDAGKGSCGFAVRLATYFPDLFAGMVLRHPVDDPKVRLGSLGGVHFLLLSSADTAEACKAMKERFDKIDPAICTVLQTTDAYPHPAAAPEIEKWMAGVKRDFHRKKIVIEPNDDRFRKSYWVGIEKMLSVYTAPEALKPRVEVEADRAQNRIRITSVGVESIFLTLNDSLVDLDKPFTIVVNDKAMTEQRARSFNEMWKYMLQKFDPEFLFPVQFRVQVPEPEKKAAEAGGGK